ncbi:unnamed protein product [Anisakis simplex]|uniref:Zgc: n=1 Tax=Anisakis simplex TaxID=6269 RepID=A0A0M3K129_ANISI|nr:unnamed protein product [Anisakis simplex]
MCCSFLGQLVYGALMLVALGLTVASMFSPGWTKIKDLTDESLQNMSHITAEIKDGKVNIPKVNGIFPFLCRMPEGTSTPHNSTDDGGSTALLILAADENSIDYCENFWNNLPTWEKVVVAMMCLALITEVIALVVTLVTICACCCKKAFMFLLPVLALLISIFLLVAVVTFAIKNKHFLDDVISKVDTKSMTVDKSGAEDSIKQNMKTEAGYSFYLAVGALIAAAVDVVVGSLAQCFAKCFL